MRANFDPPLVLDPRNTEKSSCPDHWGANPKASKHDQARVELQTHPQTTLGFILEVYAVEYRPETGRLRPGRGGWRAGFASREADGKIL